MAIGERIRLARSMAGLSGDALAQKTGDITKQAISKYETGKDIPSSGVLIRLARALGVTLDFLVRPTEAPLGELQFRKISKVGPKDKARLQAYVLDALERRLTAERIVYPEGCPPFSGVRDLQVASLEQAESAAQKCRDRLELGTDPVADLTATLEAWCIRVVRAPVAVKGFDGVGGWARPDVPFIMVPDDADIPGDRRRLTLAHELGHLVMRCAPAVDVEKAAYRFAGAFLIPRETLVRYLGGSRSRISLEELRQLKPIYGASIAALAVRAKDCGIIGEASYTSLFMELGRRGWRRDEPVAIPGEEPTGMHRLVEHALAEGLISRSRAAELSGLSLVEFERRQGGG